MDTSKLSLLKNSINADIANGELGWINKHALLRGESSVIESYLTQKARKVAREQSISGTNEDMFTIYKSFFNQFTETLENTQCTPSIYLERMSSLVGFEAGKRWHSL
ncbi:hypothetical protein VIN01S_34720 [Vibrio inusitatus NBRC 102082]|uniref:Uncharacterized protein n=1 Tax=Vibrio inusitatus NBRC 102082 TaxID=1219070 RepID=A0A4Y3I093_9VIBR|nr:hypothetical protein [Vibrio inusitatus]GEA52668.1 hypothetical protein VIN01S_34720 [Vibrio inusitatus NBRC 102082]